MAHGFCNKAIVIECPLFIPFEPHSVSSSIWSGIGSDQTYNY